MSKPIGIDLGTTNSLAAVWRRGRYEIIPVDSEHLMPSVISITPDNTVLVGRQARGRQLIAPQESVASAKRYMGDGVTQWEIHGQVYQPVDVAALVLGRLKDAAEHFLGEPVREAVITVPAYFTANQKRDTKVAGERAGFHVLSLLPEPTAAAISYGLAKEKSQLILVYDLGGGTFDVSILSIRSHRFTVEAVDGDFHLGGDDFDRLLARYLLTQLEQRLASELPELRALLESQTPVFDETSAPYLRTFQQLLTAAEQAKIELSQREISATIVRIPEIQGVALETEVSLDQFNALISPLVERTIEKIYHVLQSARLRIEDIDRVILVGGSTRNRLVRQRVSETIKEPWVSDQVDETVAQGAAAVAAMLTSPDESHDQMLPTTQEDARDRMLPVEFTNVTPFHLGVKAAQGDADDRFQILIKKNAALPARARKEFTTRKANQRSVDVQVYQGDSDLCAENVLLGGFRLEGIPPGAAGEPHIQVEFVMDSSDLLTVSATCSNVAQQCVLDVNQINALSAMDADQQRMDVIFLIDTSGSMGAELEGVRSSCLSFARQIEEGGYDCRLGVMDFAISSGKYLYELFGPTTSEQAQHYLNDHAKIAIGKRGYGGCYIGDPDTVPVIQALIDGFPDLARRRVAVLLSDEVGNNALAIADIISRLTEAGVIFHAVGVKESCHQTIALATGGRFWDINAYSGKADFSDLINHIAREITGLAVC